MTFTFSCSTTYRTSTLVSAILLVVRAGCRRSSCCSFCHNKNRLKIKTTPKPKTEATYRGICMILIACLPSSLIRVSNFSRTRKNIFGLFSKNRFASQQYPRLRLDLRNKNLNFQKRSMVQGVRIDPEDNCIININPATGEIISRVLCTPLDAIPLIVRGAKEALPVWQGYKLSDRIQMLKQGLETLRKQKESVAKMIVQEMGKPLAEAEEEVDFATQKDDYFRVMLETLQPQKQGESCVVIRQALGVVAVLSPWNFPADEILLLTLPALASGNTVILKPSEVSPETGRMVAEALQQHLPPGVLQMVQGDGLVGSNLVQHVGINMVAMTGSSSTGKKILQSAASSLKRCVLELGGKDPMIVFDDANIDDAAEDAVTYSLSNTGQVCCSIERIYVAEKIADEFAKKVVECAKSHVVGNGMDEGVTVGPLVSLTQKEIVQSQVDDAVQKGAKILYQSSVPEMPSAETSSRYYPVTVLQGLTPSMKMYYEETFGPIVALTNFDGSEAEAVKLANDSEYGLASAVYTVDLEKASRVANSIEAGQVGINCYSLENMDAGCPWVGHKNSGYGYHSGYQGFLQFSLPKTLVYKS